MSTVRPGLRFAFLLLLGANLAAQEAEPLRADRYELGVGESLQLSWADVGSGRSAWPGSLEWAFVRGAGEQENLQDLARSAQGGSARLTLSKAGIALIGIDRRAEVRDVPRAEFQTFLSTAIPEANLPKAPFDPQGSGPIRVRRLDSAKLLVRVVGEEGFLPNSATAQSKTGQRAEIRPLADPTSLPLKADLPLRVYLPQARGQRLRVRARHVPSSRTQSFLTDAGGTGYFSVELSGLWVVETYHATPTNEDPEADWEVIGATLTFEVPHVDPRSESR